MLNIVIKPFLYDAYILALRSSYPRSLTRRISTYSRQAVPPTAHESFIFTLLYTFTSPSPPSFFFFFFSPIHIFDNLSATRCPVCLQAYVAAPSLLAALPSSPTTLPSSSSSVKNSCVIYTNHFQSLKRIRQSTRS